jgi:hypothetical protein
MSLANRQHVGEGRSVPIQEPVETVPAPQLAPSTLSRPIKPSGLIFVGIVSVLLGLWGGVIPFIGPTFGFSADGSRGWNASSAHLLLAVLPGAVAFLAGVIMVSTAPRAVSGGGRGSLVMAGFLALLAGGWFVIGPLARPVLSSAGNYFVGAGALRELAFQVGYALGPGLLIALTGGFALGWSVRHQRLAGVTVVRAESSARLHRSRRRAAVTEDPTAVPTSLAGNPMASTEPAPPTVLGSEPSSERTL